MRHFVRWLISMVLVALPLACAEPTNFEEAFPGDTFQLFEQADTLELFSLEPAVSNEATMHGWKVLGQLPIIDAGTRAEIVSSLRSAMNEAYLAKRPCFKPRHA